MVESVRVELRRCLEVVVSLDDMVVDLRWAWSLSRGMTSVVDSHEKSGCEYDQPCSGRKGACI